VSTFLYALAKRLTAARRWVLAVWLVALAALGGLAGLVGQGLDSNAEIPGTESTTALDRLVHTFPQTDGASAQILVVAPAGGDVTDADYREQIAAAIDRLESHPEVHAVTSPYNEMTAVGVSEDHLAANIAIQMEGGLTTTSDEAKQEIIDAAADLAAALPQAESVTYGGALFAVELPGVSITELFGVVVALGILIITLSSLIAAGMPIIIAGVGVAASLSVMLAATSFMSVNSTAPTLALMLGLAVGIDYALFIVSRHRDQLRDGMDVDESIARAVATSGSAVIFAGITVIIALLGLSVAGIPFLSGVGLFTAIGIALAVLAALTLLPALLGFAGARITPKPRRARKAKSERPAREPGRIFRGWVRGVTKHPIITIVAVLVVLGSAIIPATTLRLTLIDAGSLPKESQTRETYDLVAEHFGPGYNAALIATGTIITSNDPIGLMDELGEEIAQVPGVLAVPISTPNETGDTGLVQIIPVGGPSDQSTIDLVTELRSMHDHFEEKYGIDIAITGRTAVTIDTSARLGQAIVPFGILVVGLSLVLLMIVFRSVWVPIKATLGYLLSVVAAFGAVTLVFEHGVLADLLNVSAQGPIISFMPIIVMGVLFGLAMDYELFLVSRMREDYVHGRTAKEAVESGFMGSARVVTAAALIMFAVFASFVPEGNSTVKPMALGLAVGVFVDAFIVRMTLVPAVMALLGRHAWWMPRWLDRILPKLDVEGEGLARQLEQRDAIERGEPVETIDPEVVARRRRRRTPVLAATAATMVATLLAGMALVGLSGTGRSSSTSAGQATGAIVNLDEPVTIDGQLIPLGRQLAAKLVGGEAAEISGGDFTWIITDAEDAADGLEDGEYDFAVIIPENFSAAATSMTGDDPVQATLEVTTAQGGSAFADAAGAAVVSAAVTLAGAELTETYLDNVLVGFGTLHDRLGEAAEGASELADGLTKLSDGADSLADGAASLAAGAATLADGAGQAAGGAHQLADGVRQLADGSGRLADGATGLAGGAATLRASMAPVVSGAGEAAEGAAALTDGAAQVAAGLDTLQTSIGEQADAIVTLAAMCRFTGASSAFCDQLDALAAASTDPTAAAQLEALVDGGHAVADGASALADGTAGIADGTSRLAGGASQLADGAAELAGGAKDLAAGAAGARTGADTLAGSLDQLADGSRSIASGSRSLADGAKQLADGSVTARDGSTTLADGLGSAIDEIPSYTDAEREQLAKVVAQPITTPTGIVPTRVEDAVERLLDTPLTWVVVAVWLATVAGAITWGARARARV